MTTRSADATIKGYYYQFDTTILKLLELKGDDDSITVEGIEDIDINTATDQSTVQCKYLSKPNFINSAVRDPIILMLDHYISTSTSNDLTYILYAHFENEIPGSEPTIDLQGLKDILSYTEKKVQKYHHIEKGISDVKLTNFLAQFKLKFGIEFYTQQKLVIEKLKTKFSCNDYEADTLFYNNALRIVIDKAILPTDLLRSISKRDFLLSIDCRKKLFNQWFIKLRSKKELLKVTAEALRSTRALEASRTKTIFIDRNILAADNDELPLEIFIENLVQRYYKIGYSLRNSKPLTLVVGTDTSSISNLKKQLLRQDIYFNDGFEHLEFTSAIFNRDPVINTLNGSKLSKSSFLIKIICKDTYITNLALINTTTVLFSFSSEDCPFRFASGQFFDIRYCETLKDVYKLLAP